MPYHTNRVEDLLFKHKSVVKVDMADLYGEKENLANFLRSHFKLDSSITPKGLELNMDDVSTYSLARMVNKFVYHKNLNSTHWVTAENNVVKINRFKGTTKKNKRKACPIKPLHKAGDYKTQPQIHFFNPQQTFPFQV